MTRSIVTDPAEPTDGHEDAPVDWDAVEAGSVVVQALRLKRHDRPNSRFDDLSWSLLPMDVPPGATHNLHWVPGPKAQDFSFPSHLIPAFKRIAWLMINRPAPDAYLAGTSGSRWPSAGSIYDRFRALRRFGAFLGEQGITQLSEVSDDLLDTYASALLADSSRPSSAGKAQDLSSVGGIAFLAEYLPEADRMIHPSWSGKSDEGRRRGTDNSKEIIHPDTFAPLLWWAQQIIPCVGDIAQAVCWRNSAMSRPRVKEGTAAGFKVVASIVEARNGKLPQSNHAGYVAAQYLIALHGGGAYPSDFTNWRKTKRGTFTVDPGLPQPVPVAVNSSIEGRPWLPHVDFREIDRLQRVLQAAAAVLICACTGMRGEECLRLPRGALRIVPRPDGAHSYRIDGRIFKAVRDKNDEQDRDGKKWIWATIKPGADAVEALEMLADAAGSNELFFLPDDHESAGLTTGGMARWIKELIDYANELLTRLKVNPVHHIASDPAGNVTLDRFRRSIAWHIVNQPEGLLAAGVQFGHMQSTTTEGYASTMTSGIAATMDQERRKALYSTLQDNANAAKTGMNVSGPAATRLGGALNRFAAKEFPGTFAELSAKDERRLRSDPDLAVRENPGHGCLCLANPLKPETMACSRGNDGEPNRNDCRTYCGNRAYTDATIERDRLEANQLRERISQVNPILGARIAKRISHLEEHIADHERDGQSLKAIMDADSRVPVDETTVDGSKTRSSDDETK